MIRKYWGHFNIITRDHFYHSGGSIENRKAVVEALVCNFDLEGFEVHNHGVKERSLVTQGVLLEPNVHWRIHSA